MALLESWLAIRLLTGVISTARLDETLMREKKIILTMRKIDFFMLLGRSGFLWVDSESELIGILMEEDGCFNLLPPQKIGLPSPFVIFFLIWPSFILVLYFLSNNFGIKNL